MLAFDIVVIWIIPPGLCLLLIGLYVNAVTVAVTEKKLTFVNSYGNVQSLVGYQSPT